jgi:hypothetical protein
VACAAIGILRRGRSTLADETPKSSFELAMERLKKKDREAGIEEKPLTDAQREAIAEAKRVCEAKLAEREILYQSSLRKTLADPEAAAALEKEYRRDRELINGERERKVAEIRSK